MILNTLKNSRIIWRAVGKRAAAEPAGFKRTFARALFDEFYLENLAADESFPSARLKRIGSVLGTPCIDNGYTSVFPVLGRGDNTNKETGGGFGMPLTIPS